MTTATRRTAIDDLYSYTGMPAQGARMLERSLQPRSDEVLLEAAADAGAGPGTVILDAGCRESSWPIKLAQRFDCRVIGLDLVATWLPDSFKDIAENGLVDSIRLIQGDIED